MTFLCRHILLGSTLAFGWAEDMRIPETHGSSLRGDPVLLPDALRDKLGVLVLGFNQSSREAVTGWGRRLAAEYRESPDIFYYEMPVLASVPRLFRGSVVKSMKSSVPERAQARFLPITSDETTWRALVRYSKPDDAYVLLVDEDGKVLWRAEGAPTDASLDALKQRIEASHVERRRNSDVRVGCAGAMKRSVFLQRWCYR